MTINRRSEIGRALRGVCRYGTPEFMVRLNMECLGKEFICVQTPRRLTRHAARARSRGLKLLRSFGSS